MMRSMSEAAAKEAGKQTVKEGTKEMQNGDLDTTMDDAEAKAKVSPPILHENKFTPVMLTVLFIRECGHNTVDVSLKALVHCFGSVETHVLDRLYTLSQKYHQVKTRPDFFPIARTGDHSLVTFDKQIIIFHPSVIYTMIHQSQL